MMIHRHRPSQSTTKHIRLYTENCQSCWKCVETCPQKVFKKINIIIHKHARIDASKECTGCFKCVKVCAFDAIKPVNETKN